MNNWKETTLKEITEKVIDNRGKTPTIVNSGCELLEVNAISEDKREPDYSKVTKFVDEKTYRTWFRNGHVKENDILIPTVGTIGNVSFSKQNRGSIAQNLIALRIKKEHDPLFIFYKLKSPTFKKQILNLDIGGVQPSVKVPHLLAQEISLPILEEQKEIAAVLSSLDDKIELLRKQNETLEKIAQEIFKEWFVNFKIDGKKLKLKKKIPEGWRVGKMSEVVKICGGTTPDTKNLEYWNGNINWTSPKDLSNCKEIFLTKTENKITEKGLAKIGSGLLPVKTLLLSSRAPIGYLAITNIPVAINQGYIAFLPNGFFSNEYMYLWLKLNMDKVISSANGSTFLEISKTSFKNIEAIIPEKAMLDNFQIVIEPTFDKILNNINQIRTLTRLRDTLLPKLMSGEIKVYIRC